MKNIIKSFMKRCDFIIKINDSIKEFYYKYLISDERILAKQFKERVGRKLELENPVMFNDKIQWLKLNWKDQLATKCSDKYEVRKIVKERIGDEYLNELIEVYNSVEEIDIRKLPEKFVLKTTHGSGTNIICRNKNEINWEEAFGEMRRWMRTNYYLKKREYAYQDIKPRIICEKFIETDNDKPPNDYKLFCFNGEPKALFIATDRGTNTCFDFYDLEWNHLNVVNHYPNSGKIEKNQNLLS